MVSPCRSKSWKTHGEVLYLLTLSCVCFWATYAKRKATSPMITSDQKVAGSSPAGCTIFPINVINGFRRFKTFEFRLNVYCLATSWPFSQVRAVSCANNRSVTTKINRASICDRPSQRHLITNGYGFELRRRYLRSCTIETMKRNKQRRKALGH